MFIGVLSDQSVLVRAAPPAAAIVVGLVLIAVGLAVIILRKPLRDIVLRVQGIAFGETVRKRMEKARPWSYSVAGAIAIAIGCISLIVGARRP